MENDNSSDFADFSASSSVTRQKRRLQLQQQQLRSQTSNISDDNKQQQPDDDDDDDGSMSGDDMMLMNDDPDDDDFDPADASSASDIDLQPSPGLDLDDEDELIPLSKGPTNTSKSTISNSNKHHQTNKNIVPVTKCEETSNSPIPAPQQAPLAPTTQPSSSSASSIQNNSSTNKRLSVRLRKETGVKVPATTTTSSASSTTTTSAAPIPPNTPTHGTSIKNLFPGRPRIRRRKLTTILNFTENISNLTTTTTTVSTTTTSTTSFIGKFKSDFDEIVEMRIVDNKNTNNEETMKQEIPLKSADDETVSTQTPKIKEEPRFESSETNEQESKPTNELLASVNTTTASTSTTSSTMNNNPSQQPESMNIPDHANNNNNNRKRLTNHPGKIKGKLSGGGRRPAKTMNEYRKKRGPKGKFKNYSSATSSSTAIHHSSTGYGTSLVAYNSLTTIADNSNDKQDDNGTESKIILCNSKDHFVLSQDVCLMCGSFGQDGEGRLLSCAQCGQCYHSFCAGIKLTPIMLKKGWRCLECTVCEGCGKPTDESRLLLCDDCDISYHTYCLDPPLEEVPRGTWKCQWCVVCVKCRQTSPGYRCQWQENYTLCAPCASQEKCSACGNHYQENDLIIQCKQCQRWLHSKCDSMFDEDECEIASSIGYNCLNCRLDNEPPLHIQARKNGTLRSIFQKKRAEEVLMKKNEAEKSQLSDNLDNSSSTNNNSNNNNNNNQNGTENSALMHKMLLSKYHQVDGMYLSEAGVAMIKAQTLEPPKKPRMKRKSPLNESDETNKDEEQSVDDATPAETEEERKKRLRNLRSYKLGIGGFLVKQHRGGSKTTNNIFEDENSQDGQDRLADGSNGAQDAKTTTKPRRRKKKNQLQDQYPAYLQEAFFGKDLLDDIRKKKDSKDSEESENDVGGVDENDGYVIDGLDSEGMSKMTISSDKIVNLDSLDFVEKIQNNKNKQLGIKNEKNNAATNSTTAPSSTAADDNIDSFLDENFPAAENFDDFTMLSPPDDAFFDILMSDDAAADAAAGDDDGSSIMLNDLNPDSNKIQTKLENSDQSNIEVEPQKTNAPTTGPDNQNADDEDIMAVDTSSFVNFQKFPTGSDQVVTDDSLPQMDSKDVEDLFEVMSNSSCSTNTTQQQPMGAPPMVAPPPPSHPPPGQAMEPCVAPQVMPMMPHPHHHPQQQQQPRPPPVPTPLDLPPLMNHPPPPPPHGPPPPHHHPHAHPHAHHHGQAPPPMNKPVCSDVLSGPSTPVTPLSGNMTGPSDSLQTLQQQFSNHPSFGNESPMTPQPGNPYGKMLQQQSSMDSGYYGMPPSTPAPSSGQEQESETTSQGQKNYIKWEAEEALGEYATISAVLYANINHPNLKTDYPAWADRIKQIHKIWRQLSTEQRQPYLQRARDNRSANKKNQAEMIQKMEKPPPTPQNPMMQQQHPSQTSSNPDMPCGPGQGPYGPPPMPNEYGPGHPGTPKMHPQQQQQPQFGMHQGGPPTPMGQQVPCSPNHGMMPSPSPHPTHHPHHASSAPISPRFRENQNYGPQTPAPPSHHPHMMRPAGTPANPFSPNSPSIMHGGEMGPHPYAAAGGHRPTPPPPFSSPNHHPPPGIHPTDPYGSKPHTPDSTGGGAYMPATPATGGSSLPSTPQPPPSSPQLSLQPVPSPITNSNEMMYARSPSAAAGPRPPPPVVRQSSAQFDDYNSPQYQSGGSGYMSDGGGGSGYSNPPTPQQPDMGGGKMMPQQRPPPPNVVRPSLGTGPNVVRVPPPYNMVRPGPSPLVDNDDPNKQQHLRNLLQVQQMQRQRQDSPNTTPSPVSTPGTPRGQPPIWPQSDQNNQNNFRPPMSPMMMNTARNRMQQMPPQQQPPPPPPIQHSSFNDPQQRMMMQQQHRNPVGSDIRFRQPNQMQPPQQQQQQQQFQRFQMQQQQQRPPGMLQQTQQQQPRMMQQQTPLGPPPQQWPPTSNSNQMMSPRSMMQPQPQPQQNVPMQNFQQQPQPQQPPQQQQMGGQVLKVDNNNASCAMVKQEMPPQTTSQTDDVVGEESLPVVELVPDDDELLMNENDFDILAYGDPELDDNNPAGTSNVSGSSGYAGGHAGNKTSSILDELDDDRDIIGAATADNKDKDDQNKDKNKPIGQQTQMKHEPQSQQQYFANTSECFMSDDDFERLKNDYLNDEPASQTAPPPPPPQQQQPMPPTSQMNPVVGTGGYGPATPQPPQMPVHHNMPPQQPQQQVYQQAQQQYNTSVPQQPMGMNAPPMPPGRMPFHHHAPQPQPGPHQNRMQFRMHGQGPPPPPSPMHARHMPPQAGMYGPGPGMPPGNRVILQQQQQPVNQMMRPQQPPPPQLDDQSQYGGMVQQDPQNNMSKMLQGQKQLEGELANLRKMKKSLNAKQRQCRKNQNELNEHDANELARITQAIISSQRKLEQIRKAVRNGQQQQDGQQPKRKPGPSTAGSAAASAAVAQHSPSHPHQSTSPRSTSVNSPMAAGANFPSTPQSPSLTSASPSSLMQTNSPMSSLHSPASMMPPSPMIVQDDNNPFSDVYLQKEKKQQAPPPGMYGHHQYSAGPPPPFDDMQQPPPAGPPQQQQYYQSPGHHPGTPTGGQPPYQMMRSQSMNQFVAPGNNSGAYRFQGGPSPGSAPPPPPPHFSNQPSMNYQQQQPPQQIRRPPPPPYPGNPAAQQPPPQYGGGVRPSYPPPPSPQQQIRMQSQQPPAMRMECMMNNQQPATPSPTASAASMTPTHHPIYATSSVDNTGQSMMNDPWTSTGGDGALLSGLVGEAETTMEFSMSEPGNGCDNESDPFTFQKEQEEQNKAKQQQQQNEVVEQAQPPPPPQQSSNATDVTVVNDNSDQQQSAETQPAPTTTPTTLNHLTTTTADNDQQQHAQPAEATAQAQTNPTNTITNDDSSKEQQDSASQTIKQNALLKKLLQNCPSADLKSSMLNSTQILQQQLTQDNGEQQPPPPQQASNQMKQETSIIQIMDNNQQNNSETVEKTIAPEPVEVVAVVSTASVPETPVPPVTSTLTTPMEEVSAKPQVPVVPAEPPPKSDTSTDKSIPELITVANQQPIPPVTSATDIQSTGENSSSTTTITTTTLVATITTATAPTTTTTTCITTDNITTPVTAAAVVVSTVITTTPTTTTTTSMATTSPVTTTPPVVEKKLSYLDIRRAQLEREPTPPLEDIKPKRKRTAKRKESNNNNNKNESTASDSMMNSFSLLNDHNSNSSCSNGATTATPKAKKRSRSKGSQSKSQNEDSMDSMINNNDKILQTIIQHFRTLPPVPLEEPEVKMNLNVCLPPDGAVVDFNSHHHHYHHSRIQKPVLKGCYGNASLSSAIDYYSTYPFGPNKPQQTANYYNHNLQNANNRNPNNTNNNCSKVGYYSEEFGCRSILDQVKMETGAKSEKQYRQNKPAITACEYGNANLSLYCRDLDSPETVVSASSPECVMYDEPKDEYNRMKYINDLDDDDHHSRDSTGLNSENDDDEDRKSPFLRFFPTNIQRPIPRRPFLNRENKENYDDDDDDKEPRLAKLAKLASGPLKESNNVGITIMIKPEYNVKDVMKALAKLLQLNQKFLTYNVEKSSTTANNTGQPISQSITETLEIMDIGPGAVYCKFCHCLIKDQNGGYKTEDDDLMVIDDDHGSFCNKECFNNYSLANVNNIGEQHRKRKSTDDDDSVLSITKQQSHESGSNTADEVDSVVSVNEKYWKNTRYLYWNGQVFKNETESTVEPKENDEPVEDLLDRYSICLKPPASTLEKRRCIFCHELGDGKEDGPSRLLNMDVDKWVHLNCALWSYEVYEMLNGTLMNVDAAYQRAMNLNCVKCLKPGASLKCFKFRCNNSYHFPCARRDKGCVFYQDKSLLCPIHSNKGPLPIAEEMSSFVVARKVYIHRDEQKQIAGMLHQGDNNLLRIGSLTFLNIGQLMIHQLPNFHTQSYIYPVGYKVCRFYWSMRRLRKRCQYICSIEDLEGWPQFLVEVREEGYENVTYKARTARLAWEPIIEAVVRLREDSQTIKVFFDFITGEDLFGLNEPTIVRILESLPGVDTLSDYTFKYGRSPWYEMPLAINPSGCARTEPKKRFHFKRPHTLHVSSNTIHRSSLQSPLSTNSESSSPYVKQFVHSKVSQYRKMRQEWRNNVYLGRSRISGLGLYANRDIEKHTMIIEYIGLVIRNVIADRNEKLHESHNRGIYMFRLDDNRVIDATLQGGLARYMNHSCDPNCVAECVQIDRENKILIIANRRIQKGEELTYDYKFDVEDDQHKIPCLCGAANCRKWMN